MVGIRIIDANFIVKVAEHAWDEWNLAMATQDTNRGVNKVLRRQELCKAVKAVADDAPTIDPESFPIVKELQAEVENLKDQLSHLEYWQLNRKIVLESAAQDRAAVNVMRKHCEKTIAELRVELKQVKAERDAAMRFIPKTCATCKYGKSPCDWCVHDPDGDLNWEWNGKSKGGCQ